MIENSAKVWLRCGFIPKHGATLRKAGLRELYSQENVERVYFAHEIAKLTEMVLVDGAVPVGKRIYRNRKCDVFRHSDLRPKNEEEKYIDTLRLLLHASGMKLTKRRESEAKKIFRDESRP